MGRVCFRTGGAPPCWTMRRRAGDLWQQKLLQQQAMHACAPTQQCHNQVLKLDAASLAGTLAHEPRSPANDLRRTISQAPTDANHVAASAAVAQALSTPAACVGVGLCRVLRPGRSQCRGPRLGRTRLSPHGGRLGRQLRGVPQHAWRQWPAQHVCARAAPGGRSLQRAGIAPMGHRCAGD